MYYTFQDLFDPKIPTQLDSISELINDVEKSFKEMKIKIRLSRKGFDEHGFYIRSTNKNNELFFGIWLDLWQTKNYPLCISFDWTSDPERRLQHNFKKIIESINSLNIEYLVFNDYPVIGFKKEFFEEIQNTKPITILIKKIADELHFGLIAQR